MRYICSICGYIYDEGKESVLFADLPDDWTCPLCGAPKSAFVPEEDPGREKKPGAHADKARTETADSEEDLTKLTAGELSALFSNLAKGCEKLYQEEGKELFAKIADHYKALTPPVENADLEHLVQMIKKDLDKDYKILYERAAGINDRGMLRAFTWGSKVTRILKSLIDRYKKEGDALLENTEIWVCSVCGFVYIGEKPPVVCPICKVPSWKFCKVEGRKQQ